MRMKALASQSASGTVTDAERAFIDAEYQQLLTEIDDTATSTRYNGESLLTAANMYAAGVDVMVGSDATDVIAITLTGLDTTTLTVNGGDVADQTNANTALGDIDAALDAVSNARAEIGAQQSRFEFRASTLATSTENLSSANSAIEDVDIAAEQAKLSSAEVKVQAAVAAAASANQMPQALLKLLG